MDTVNSLLAEKKNNAFTYFKSERELEVKLSFKLELVRPQELLNKMLSFFFFFSIAQCKINVQHHDQTGH